MSVRIALVEHDAAFSRLVSNILSLEGCETIVCDSETSPHDVISKQKPDLIILDTWLENQESGWHLLQTLLLDETTNNIPIIIATGEVADYEQRAPDWQELTTVRLLKKPFTPDQLLAAVREALDGTDPATGT